MDEPPAPWLERVALVLFAPAHSGAHVIELAKEALGSMPASVGDFVAAGIEGYAQVLNDLKPESPALKRLQEDTHRLIQEGHRSLRAKVVVIGKKDRIVSAVRFCADPGPRVVEGKGHIGICKPDAAYSIPLGHLLPHI
jgi:hypothetical protein